jgi:hypothetical protein
MATKTKSGINNYRIICCKDGRSKEIDASIAHDGYMFHQLPHFIFSLRTLLLTHYYFWNRVHLWSPPADGLFFESDVGEETPLSAHTVM